MPILSATRLASPDAIFRALADLRTHQPLNAQTGGHHAAALCAADGTIRLVREDVGRHNAFDKLIGAMGRQGLGWEGGFALLSSRCSYELVEKAVLAGCPLLAAISVPTAIAVARAREAGLALVVLARAGFAAVDEAVKLLGAVLAGGSSTRFGSDKALALLAGKPLIEHAIARACGADRRRHRLRPRMGRLGGGYGPSPGSARSVESAPRSTRARRAAMTRC